MSTIPQLTHVTRRLLLSGLSASLAFVGASGLAYADGGRGPVDSACTSHNIDNSSTKKKSKTLDVIYTQKNLHKVKDKDLKTAIRANKLGHSVVIEGFTKNGSNIVFEMLLISRKSTLLILKEVQKKKKRADRKHTLWGHYEEAVENAEAATIVSFRWERAWRDLVRKWMLNPMEGAKKSKKKKTKKAKTKRTNEVCN